MSATPATESQIELINKLWIGLAERDLEGLKAPVVEWFHAHADFHHLTKQQATKWIDTLKMSRDLNDVMDAVISDELYSYLGHIGKRLKVVVELLEAEPEAADDSRQRAIMQEADKRVTREAFNQFNERQSKKG